MFVSGITTNHPVIKDKSYAFIRDEVSRIIDYRGDPGTQARYPICASCSAICYSTLEKLPEKPTGIEIVVVDEFPGELEKYRVPRSFLDYVDLGEVKLVLRYYVA